MDNEREGNHAAKGIRPGIKPVTTWVVLYACTTTPPPWQGLSVSWSSCTVTRVISIQCSIHFSPISATVQSILKNTSKTSTGVKVQTLLYPLSQYQPNDPWHCQLRIWPCHQGRQKSIDKIIWSLSIQVVSRPHNFDLTS